VRALLDESHEELVFCRRKRPGGEQLVKKPFEFVSASLRNKKGFIQLTEQGLAGFKASFQGRRGIALNDVVKLLRQRVLCRGHAAGVLCLA
jgi:hypothetical protein